MEINQRRLERIFPDQSEASAKNIAAILLSVEKVVGVAVIDINDRQTHAEMILLDKFDTWNILRRYDKKKRDPRLTLIRSLQPCRMCFGRISFADIRYCFYLKFDSKEIFSTDTNFPSKIKGGRISTQGKEPNGSELSEYMDILRAYSGFQYIL